MSSSDGNRISISGRNSSNSYFYDKHDVPNMATLLAHPHGLKLLKFYAETQKADSTPQTSGLVSSLATELVRVIHEIETTISSKMRKVLRSRVPLVIGQGWTVTGESAEHVEGSIDEVNVSGKPDLLLVVRTERNHVVMIAEVSVDANGGEKKIGQVFEYAKLIVGKCATQEPIQEPKLLVTIHFHRQPTLKVTLEAFLYVHNTQKLGFLWREVYEAEKGEDDLAFLNRSCICIVRCLLAARHLSGLEPNTTTWDVVSDNVAIQDKSRVFKIFDNRFHLTYRKPDVWLRTDLSWIQKFGVKFFCYKESEFAQSLLGRPTSEEEKAKQVAYPDGLTVVLDYKYVDGTHIASKASHFQSIARCISEMHLANIIHGDIRGFNMLHPSPGGGILESQLIDFDLCLSHKDDRYPPGYADRISDNRWIRIDKPEGPMKKEHDWYEPASAMGVYVMDDSYYRTLHEQGRIQEAQRTANDILQWSQAWTAMCKQQKDCRGNASLAAAIDAFIQDHGDVALALPDTIKDDWNEFVLKGTGSPPKKLHVSRGPLPVNK